MWKNLYLIAALFITQLSFSQDLDYAKKSADFLLSESWEEGIAYFEGEIAEYPNKAELYAQLARIYLGKGETKLADSLIRSSIALDSVCASCYQVGAKLARATASYKEALELCNKALSLEETPDAYLERALIYQSLGQVWEARKDVQKALDLDPEYARSYLVKAFLEMSQGYQAMAVNSINDALRLDSSNFQGYLMLSEVFLKLGNQEKALEAVDRGLGFNPENPNLYYNKALVLLAIDGPKAALLAINRAIELKPTFQYFDLRANLNYKLEDMDAACQDYHQAMDDPEAQTQYPEMVEEIKQVTSTLCDPSNAAYYYQRGIAKYNLGEYRSALEWYTKGEGKFPQHPIIISFKANAYKALGQFDSAIGNYHHSLALQADFESEVRELYQLYEGDDEEKLQVVIKQLRPETYLHLGEIYLILGDLPKSEEYLGKAMERSWQIESVILSSIYNARGVLNLQKSNFHQAKADFNRSLVYNSENAITHYYLAWVKCSEVELQDSRMFLLKVGNSSVSFTGSPLNDDAAKSRLSALKEALASIERAVELSPDSPDFLALRGVLKRELGLADYCYDLLRSAQLGFTFKEGFLKDCL